MAERGNALAGRRRWPGRGLTPLAFGYATYGAFWGAWAVVLAEYLQVRDLSLAAVGGLFSVTSVTAIATMTLAGAPAVRVPRPPALAAAFAVTAAAGLAVGVAAGAALLPAFALLGVGIGMIDVLVNLAGAELEATHGRPALQLIHAAYGAGGAVGAVLTAVAVTAGWSPTAVLAAVSAGQALAAVLALALAEHPQPGAEPSPGLALRVLRGRRDLQAVAVIVLCAFFIEGSMDAWSVLFVRATLGGPALAAAAAFAAFALAITLGRLFAARVLFGLGHQRTLMISGVGSVAAGIALVLAPSTIVAGGAFLMLGFFLSVAAPAAFGKVGGDEGAQAGIAVAAITTVGYGGFVVGPPILGWVGDRFGLRTALLALVVASLCMLAATVAGRRGDQAPATTAAGDPRR